MDYDKVKKAILQAYELVPEAYRQKFRKYRKADTQTYVEFAYQKERHFDRWCASKKVSTFDTLRQLVLVEEFKRCVNDDIKTHLEENKADNLKVVAQQVTVDLSLVLSLQQILVKNNQIQVVKRTTRSAQTKLPLKT
ncbi:hypothetical protein HOLleu_02940 [Holothuria leucospilota]|uniref:SCAN box domain-containing protein n=1 Tax=Holothuria leucospilota TaxID=206669 RepID=A0A9Q1HHC9_HOLLE|nr:hypothetical protein HOLleu_02940 [Holothuria leucospilota]